MGGHVRSDVLQTIRDSLQDVIPYAMVQPKTPPLSIRPSPEGLNRIDVYASGRKISRHAAILELIDHGAEKVNHADEAYCNLHIAWMDCCRKIDALEARLRDAETKPQPTRQAVAGARMAAHVDWLTDNGFRIAPPGTMLRPKTKDDAQAMIMAAREFLAKGQGRSSSKSKLIGSPRLILPPGATRQ